MIIDAMNTHREIETESLKIHGNCMEFNDTVIQLNNISLLSTQDVTPTKLPTWVLIVALAGLAVMLLRVSELLWLGLIMVLIAGVFLYLWYKEAQRLKELKRLVIITNSCNSFTIVFQDRPFLEKVIQVLKEVIAKPGHLSDVTINVKNNNFTGDSSVIPNFQEQDR